MQFFERPLFESECSFGCIRFKTCILVNASIYMICMCVYIYIYICITFHMTTCCTMCILKSLGRSEAESSIFSHESWDLQSLYMNHLRIHTEV